MGPNKSSARLSNCCGDGGSVTGVALSDGTHVASRAVVVATGTFLDAQLFCGLDRIAGGRRDEQASIPLARQLRELGLAQGRLKTGTPPRLDGRTIDWARLAPQPSDRDDWSMSALEPDKRPPELACAIARTNTATHAIIADNLDKSPLFAGAIEGRGPRYCPSIEDKIKRFGERDGHQIFLEPEGLDTELVYPDGISTSLPADVQQTFVNSIEGLSAAGSFARAMRLSMNMRMRASSAPRWGMAILLVCSWPGKSMAPPVMRRPPRRDWLRVSTPRPLRCDLEHHSLRSPHIVHRGDDRRSHAPGRYRTLSHDDRSGRASACVAG